MNNIIIGMAIMIRLDNITIILNVSLFYYNNDNISISFKIE